MFFNYSKITSFVDFFFWFMFCVKIEVKRECKCDNHYGVSTVADLFIYGPLEKGSMLEP